MSRSRSNDGTRNTWRSPLQAASEFLASARLCPTFTGLAIGTVAEMITYTYLVNRLLSRSPGGTKELLTSHNLTKSGSRKSKTPRFARFSLARSAGLEHATLSVRSHSPLGHEQTWEPIRRSSSRSSSHLYVS